MGTRWIQDLPSPNHCLPLRNVSKKGVTHLLFKSKDVPSTKIKDPQKGNERILNVTNCLSIIIKLILFQVLYFLYNTAGDFNQMLILKDLKYYHSMFRTETLKKLSDSLLS